MVFHKYKLIVIGVPKNASSSMFDALQNQTDYQHTHETIIETFHTQDNDLMELERRKYLLPPLKISKKFVRDFYNILVESVSSDEAYEFIFYGGELEIESNDFEAFPVSMVFHFRPS